MLQGGRVWLYPYPFPSLKDAATEATGLGPFFVVVVVLNPGVLLVNKVDFGLFETIIPILPPSSYFFPKIPLKFQLPSLEFPLTLQSDIIWRSTTHSLISNLPIQFTPIRSSSLRHLLPTPQSWQSKQPLFFFVPPFLRSNLGLPLKPPSPFFR